MNKLSRRHALVLLAGAAASAAAADALRPTQYLSRKLGPLDLEQTIPTTFGPWQMDTHAPASVVNPELSTKLQQLYSEILSRTYVEANTGYRIMLSIAYGSNQSESHSLHDPAVCYPAQGFSIQVRRSETISTRLGALTVRQLETRLGSGRPEPVTYWMTIGEQVYLTGLSRKLAQMRYALHGLIADGLVFRVSSIDRESEVAFAVHARFVESLLSSLPVDKRKRIVGKGFPA